MLEVKDDERFERQGDDLIYDLRSRSPRRRSATQFTVPTPYGDEEVKIPAGHPAETVLRLKGKGLPRLGQSGNGDLHVRVHVWTPEHLTDEQERLFQELAKLEGEPPKRSPRLLVQAQGSARRMTWWAIDVRTAPERATRLGAWLVARTGQAVEERDDGTLVTFAPDERAADALIAAAARRADVAARPCAVAPVEPVDWTHPLARRARAAPVRPAHA